jgi:CBS domain-containing protein
MRHPKRMITREIRTRRPVHPGRQRDEMEALTWPEGARVGDCMTRGVATIHPDTLARGAAEMMRTRRIRHLPVVDRGHVPDALGAVTVRELMTRAVLTVRPDTRLQEAARLMHERKIGAVPVVQGGRVVGILTETDALEVFREALKHGFAKPYRWAVAAR